MADESATVEDAKNLILDAISASAEAMIENGTKVGMTGARIGIDAAQVALLAEAWATVKGSNGQTHEGPRMTPATSFALGLSSEVDAST